MTHFAKLPQIVRFSNSIHSFIYLPIPIDGPKQQQQDTRDGGGSYRKDSERHAWGRGAEVPQCPVPPPGAWAPGANCCFPILMSARHGRAIPDPGGAAPGGGAGAFLRCPVCRPIRGDRVQFAAARFLHAPERVCPHLVAAAILGRELL